jgi:hypothetical protein
MKKGLLFTLFAVGIVSVTPQVSANTYSPYKKDNAPISRFYDPAPALTGDYYDKGSKKRVTTTPQHGMQQQTAPRTMR